MGKFFTQIVVGASSSLPEVVMEPSMIMAFMMLFNMLVDMQGIEGHGSCLGRWD